MCRFERRGGCKNGDSCPFRHLPKNAATPAEAEPTTTKPQAKGKAGTKPAGCAQVTAIGVVRGSAGTAAAATSRGVSFGKTETREFEVECLILGSSAAHRTEKLDGTPHQPRIPGGAGGPEFEQRWAHYYARKLALELGTLTAEETQPEKARQAVGNRQPSPQNMTATPARNKGNHAGPERWIMDTSAAPV